MCVILGIVGLYLQPVTWNNQIQPQLQTLLILTWNQLTWVRIFVAQSIPDNSVVLALYWPRVPVSTEDCPQHKFIVPDQILCWSSAIVLGQHQPFASTGNCQQQSRWLPVGDLLVNLHIYCRSILHTANWFEYIVKYISITFGICSIWLVLSGKHV